MLSYRWAEVDLGLFTLMSNPPGVGLDKLFLKDQILTEFLLPRGHVQFGKGPGGPGGFGPPAGPNLTQIVPKWTEAQYMAFFSTGKVAVAPLSFVRVAMGAVVSYAYGWPAIGTLPPKPFAAASWTAFLVSGP